MKIKSSKPDVPEIDMTPMIDIVFQLIAFFMVITNFEQTQADERVKLPRNSLAKPTEQAREHMLTLNIGYKRDKNGAKTDDRPFVFYVAGAKLLEEMKKPLRTESQFYETTKVPLEEVTVLIRADSEVEIGLVQELIAMCQDPEVRFVRFALAATQEVGQ